MSKFGNTRSGNPAARRKTPTTTADFMAIGRAQGKRERKAAKAYRDHRKSEENYHPALQMATACGMLMSIGLRTRDYEQKFEVNA
jgi:hypothetical protein